jgi:indole-3-glycerol phosphate synthase
MNILDQIIAEKKKAIARYQPLSPVSRFEKEGFFREFRTRSLAQRLRLPDSNGIIAEFKRRSPSKGAFKTRELEVEPVVTKYNQSAAGISVLTEEAFFDGDLDDLIQTKIVTDIPVLRKDFIIDPWQVAESRAFGADVILLIAACLSPQEVKELAVYAASLQLETLLEIHDETELGHICPEVTMIGVNNRNLNTFEVNLDTSLRLSRQLPPEKPWVAESGIRDTADMVQLRQAGFRGFLIGERFMREEDPGRAFEEFVSGIGSRES